MLARLKEIAPLNSFARGVGVLAGGTVISQALLLLATPFLTRLYSPEDFGLLAVYVGLLAILAVFVSLCYEIAIPLPEKNSEAANILVLSLLLVLVMTVLCTIAMWLFSDEIAVLLNTPQLSEFLWLLPIGLLCSGVYGAFNYFAVRIKAFSDISRTRITQNIAILVIQFGAIKLNAFALLLGHTSGRGVGCIRLAKTVANTKAFSIWSWSGVWLAARRYKNFPIFSSWSSMFNTAGEQLPTIFFASYFGAGVAGIYFLAYRVVALPLSLLGDAIAQVFFVNSAEAHRQGDLKQLFERVHSILGEIMMPVALLLIIAGPELFGLVFGEKWLQAGEMARYMSAWFYMAFTVSPLLSLLNVLEKQGVDAIFQTGYFVIRLAAILAGVFVLDDMLLTVLLLSTASVVFYLISLFWLCGVLGSSVRSILHHTLLTFIKSAIWLLPLLLFMYLKVDSNVYLIIMLAITSLLLTVYYIKVLQSVKLL